MPSLRNVVIQLHSTLSRLVGGPKSVHVVADRQGRIPTNPPIPKLNGNRDLILHVRGFGVDTGGVTGGGRHDTRVKRLIDIVLRSRKQIDTVHNDLAFLTDDNGHLAFEESVINAVQIWWGDPAAAATEAQMLLVGGGEPARIVNGGGAVRELFAGDGTWGTSVITLEVHVLLELDLAASNQ